MALRGNCPEIPDSSTIRNFRIVQIIGVNMATQDNVNHPAHYKGHPSGIECIQVTEHMGFNLGNALKYLWRCDLKKNAIEDLEKARWYIDREIAKRKLKKD